MLDVRQDRLRRFVMRAPYGLDILDNCLTCPVRTQHLFCNLSPQAAQRLNEIKSTAVYPKGAVLIIEGQQPRGVFVLCVGKGKLSTSSREGKTIITRISVQTIRPFPSARGSNRCAMIACSAFASCAMICAC